MADDVRTLLLQIDATTQLLRSNLAQAESAVAKFQQDTDRKLDQVDGKFSGLGKGLGSLKSQLLSVTTAASGLLAALGIGVGVSAFVGLGRDALDYASSLGETAQQLGVTSEQLQVYRYAASQVGVSQEEMDKGLAKLTRTLGEAQTGSKNATKVFEALGIGLKNADGTARSAGDALPLIADALSKIEEPTKRAAIEVDLFGRAGQKLDTLLSGGSGAIDELRRAAKDLGIVLDDRLIQNADAAADKLAELKQVLEARIATTVAENASAIYTLADSTIKLAASLPEATSQLRRFALQVGEASLGTVSNLTFGLVGEGARGRIRDERLNSEAFARARDGERTYQDALGSRFPSGSNFDPYHPLAPRRSAAPLASRIDSLNASPGRGGNKDVDEVQKQIDALQRSARAAIDTIHILTRDEENRQLAQKTKWFSNDDFDNIVKEIDRRRDAEFRLIEERKEQEAELARLREQSIYDLAGLYEDLFRGGTSALWRDFKAMGLRAVAEVMARLAAGDNFGSAIGNVFNPRGSGAGSTLAGLGAIFGGFFAAGGDPPLGKVSVVGERGPELFVPRVPGTIIPNGALGASPSIALTVNAPGATAETIMMIRRELAAAAPVLIQAAQTTTASALSRPRL